MNIDYLKKILTSRVYDVAIETPLELAPVLSARIGNQIFFKREDMQSVFSFKLRGAYNKMAHLSTAQLKRGVICASAGNHAQGVALAAQLLGVRATVFMPEGATIPKVQATLAYGADVRFAGSTIDEALMAAMAYGDETGAVLIHPFDHRDIVAGQGTLGLEILQKVPDVRTIVVCTGGGGLLAGIAMAVKSQRADVRIVGVQARDAAAYPGSLAAGHPVALEHMSTMADGIAVGRPGAVPFAIVRDLVDDIETVTEDEISRAVLLLLERAKLLVEPAGAAATAAVLANPKSFEPPVAVVVSGGNVDSLLLMRIIRHGLAAAGRYLTVTVRVPDRPGSLARLLAEVKDLQANVLEVQHDRLDAGLGVDEVDIVVQVETRGHEHCEEVLDALAGRYRIVSQSIDR